MARAPKAPRQAETAAPPAVPVADEAEAGSDDLGGVDPEFERAMQEPAGGSQKTLGPDDDPFAAAGFGAAVSGGSRQESTDPWEAAMGLPGIGKATSPHEQPDESHEPPQPGSARALSDEELVRKGSVDFPDDTLVTVELWEWRNGTADKVGTFQSVLYSKCRDPYTWIGYGGEWYYKITNPEQRKKLKAGFIKTRGPEAPRTWRPTFGGDEVDFKQFMEFMSKMNDAGQRGTIGVPTGVHANVEAGLRTDLGELKAELREVRTKLDQATADVAEARRQRDMASSKYDALKERYDDVKGEFASVKSELAALRANPPKTDGKPEWVYMLEATKRDDAPKLTDILLLLEKNRDKFGPAEFLAMQNSIVDSLAKIQSAGGSASKGDWSGAVEKGLGIVEKRLGMAATMQRIDQRGAPQTPQQAKQLPAAGGTVAAATTTDPKERKKIALDETMKNLLDAVRSGKAADEKDREDPQLVGEAIAASIVWAGKLGFAEEDESIFSFMQKIVADPHEAIRWFCESEGIPADYGRRVADAVKASLTPQTKTPAVPSQPPAGAAARPAPAVPPQPTGAAAAAPSSPDLGRKAEDAAVAPPPKSNGGSHVVGADGGLTAGDGVQGGGDGDVPAKPAQDAPKPQAQTVQPS